MTQRTKLGMIVAEFFGAALLTSTILAEANSSVLTNKHWFVAATAGLTLALLTITVGKLSVSFANPAVTIGLLTIRKIEASTAFVCIAVQFLGAAVALRLFQFLQNDVLQNSAGNFHVRIFIAETIGTFVFTFGVAAVVTQKMVGYKAAFAIGTSFMLGSVIAATASNGILNPALALGLNSWSWIYALAPIIGAVLGINIYDLFIAPESSFLLGKKVVTRKPITKRR